MPFIHVACFFDKAFTLPALIFATSLAQTSRRERPVMLHVFHIEDLGTDLDASLVALCGPSFRFEVKRIDNPFAPDLPIPHENPAYYLRLLLGDLIDADRVIYLDVDILVRSSLAELFDFNLGGKTIAAVPDPVINRALAEPAKSQSLFLSSVVIRTYIETFVPPSHVYFNSGAMVVDLTRWRSGRVTDRAFDALRGRYHVLFADQDILNEVLQDDAAYLGSEWNCMPALQPDGSCEGARILHFAGYKPFRYRDLPHESDAIYWRFAMSTPYGARLRDTVHEAYLRDLRELREGLTKVPRVPRRNAWANAASRVLKRVATFR